MLSVKGETPSAPTPMPVPIMMPARQRAGHGRWAERLPELRGGLLLAGAAVMTVMLGVAVWRLTGNPAPAYASAGESVVRQTEARPALLTRVEVAPVVPFAESHMAAGLAMKDFEVAFEDWMSARTDSAREDAVRAMERAREELVPPIESSKDSHPGPSELWSAHRELQRALILNAQGRREDILPTLQRAARHFRATESHDDPALAADLAGSLQNASGTYKFILGVEHDPLFEPLRQAAR